MALSNRLLCMLEAELNQLVVFSYDLVRRLNATGSPRTFLRVWLRNDAPVALTDVRGRISPASAGSFESASFEVGSLPPGREIEIALMPAELLGAERNHAALDQAAVVRFRSCADLSGFSFSSLNRPILYAERLAAWEPRLRKARRLIEHAPVGRRARAIPLSG
jgi:hypothetical protein